MGEMDEIIAGKCFIEFEVEWSSNIPIINGEYP